MKKIAYLSCLIVSLCLYSALACAEPQQSSTTTLPDKPAKPQASRSTPVAIEHEGADSLGAKLAYGLKEIFNAGTLFSLTEKDTPKVRLLLFTSPEFGERPNIGSSYAAVWLFSQNESTLRHYLAAETGTVSEENMADLITHLAQRTDGIAVKYSYLFP